MESNALTSNMPASRELMGSWEVARWTARREKCMARNAASSKNYPKKGQPPRRSAPGSR